MQRRDITEASRVSGAAANDDPGFELPGTGVEAQDFYRVTTTTPVRITLIVGANELFTFDPDSDPPTIEAVNDLDLAVLDDQGDLIDFSEGLIDTETVDVSAIGELVIAVRASAGSSPYVLGVTPLELVSDAGAAPALAVPSPAPEFVPGEVLMKRAPAAATSAKKRNALATVTRGAVPEIASPRRGSARAQRNRHLHQTQGRWEPGQDRPDGDRNACAEGSDARGGQAPPGRSRSRVGATELHPQSSAHPGRRALRPPVAL